MTFFKNSALILCKICHNGGENLLLHFRYEKGSVIFTSNTTFSQWEGIFGTPARSSAIVDRIVHHSIIIKIEGESYRLGNRLSPTVMTLDNY